MAKVTHNPVNDSAGTKAAQSEAAYAAVGKLLSGYADGFELVKGKQQDAIERFVVIRAGGMPRLLLPGESAALQTAVASFLGQRRMARVLPSLVKVASRAGSLLGTADVNLSLLSQENAVSPLRKLMSEVLERDDFHIAMRLSFGRPNAKTVAMAISDTGEELCFAKFGSESMTNDMVEHESAVLKRYQNVDMPMIMPELLHAGSWAGDHNVLITAPLQIKPLPRDARAAHKASDDFASLNVLESAALVESKYWRQLGDRVEKLENQGTDVTQLKSHMAAIEKIWGKSTFDFGPSHGDWSRANLGMVDAHIAAFDWERCTELAPRGIDTAHFAIYEKPKRRFSKELDIDRIADNLTLYQSAAGLEAKNVKPLVLLGLLEMVIRFKSAQVVGMKTQDKKFEPALIAGLQSWTA